MPRTPIRSAWNGGCSRNPPIRYLYAVSVADSERQMRELHARFERLPSVGHVESLAMRLPPAPTDETRQLLGQVRSQLSYVPAQLPAIPSADPIATGKAIENFYVKVKKYAEEEHAKRVAETTDGFLNRFEKLSQSEQTRLLNQFQYRMAVDLLGRFQALRYASNDEEIQASDLPNELVSRYVSAARCRRQGPNGFCKSIPRNGSRMKRRSPGS